MLGSVVQRVMRDSQVGNHRLSSNSSGSSIAHGHGDAQLHAALGHVGPALFPSIYSLLQHHIIVLAKEQRDSPHSGGGGSNSSSGVVGVSTALASHRSPLSQGVESWLEGSSTRGSSLYAGYAGLDVEDDDEGDGVSHPSLVSSSSTTQQHTKKSQKNVLEFVEALLSHLLETLPDCVVDETERWLDSWRLQQHRAGAHAVVPVDRLEGRQFAWRPPMDLLLHQPSPSPDQAVPASAAPTDAGNVKCLPPASMRLTPSVWCGPYHAGTTAGRRPPSLIEFGTWMEAAALYGRPVHIRCVFKDAPAVVTAYKRWLSFSSQAAATATGQSNPAHKLNLPTAIAENASTSTTTTANRTRNAPKDKDALHPTGIAGSTLSKHAIASTVLSAVEQRCYRELVASAARTAPVLALLKPHDNVLQTYGVVSGNFGTKMLSSQTIVPSYSAAPTTRASEKKQQHGLDRPFLASIHPRYRWCRAVPTAPMHPLDTPSPFPSSSTSSCPSEPVAMSLRDWLQHLRNAGRRLSLVTLTRLARDVSCGLSHLHQGGIILRALDCGVVAAVFDDIGVDNEDSLGDERHDLRCRCIECNDRQQESDVSCTPWSNTENAFSMMNPSRFVVSDYSFALFAPRGRAPAPGMWLPSVSAPELRKASSMAGGAESITFDTLAETWAFGLLIIEVCCYGDQQLALSLADQYVDEGAHQPSATRNRGGLNIGYAHTTPELAGGATVSPRASAAATATVGIGMMQQRGDSSDPVPPAVWESLIEPCLRRRERRITPFEDVAVRAEALHHRVVTEPGGDCGRNQQGDKERWRDRDGSGLHSASGILSSHMELLQPQDSSLTNVGRVGAHSRGLVPFPSDGASYYEYNRLLGLGVAGTVKSDAQVILRGNAVAALMFPSSSFDVHTNDQQQEDTASAWNDVVDVLNANSCLSELTVEAPADLAQSVDYTDTFTSHDAVPRSRVGGYALAGQHLDRTLVNRAKMCERLTRLQPMALRSLSVSSSSSTSSATATAMLKSTFITSRPSSSTPIFLSHLVLPCLSPTLTTLTLQGLRWVNDSLGLDDTRLAKHLVTLGLSRCTSLTSLTLADLGAALASQTADALLKAVTTRHELKPPTAPPLVVSSASFALTSESTVKQDIHAEENAHDNVSLSASVVSSRAFSSHPPPSWPSTLTFISLGGDSRLTPSDWSRLCAQWWQRGDVASPRLRTIDLRGATTLDYYAISAGLCQVIRQRAAEPYHIPLRISDTQCSSTDTDGVSAQEASEPKNKEGVSDSTAGHLATIDLRGVSLSSAARRQLEAASVRSYVQVKMD